MQKVKDRSIIGEAMSTEGVELRALCQVISRKAEVSPACTLSWLCYFERSYGHSDEVAAPAHG